MGLRLGLLLGYLVGGVGIAHTGEGEKWLWEGYGQVDDLSMAFMGNVDRGMWKHGNN